MKKGLLFALLMQAALGQTVRVCAQKAEIPTVRAVLFFSPTCPHCQYVITKVLMLLVVRAAPANTPPMAFPDRH